MTTRSTQSAYPIYGSGCTAQINSLGLTKRELFAVQILTGLLTIPDRLADDQVVNAVKLADSLIDELNRTEPVQSPLPPPSFI